MKKHILFIAIFLSSTISIFAQWTTNGNNVTIDKNIGIGTSNPVVKLDVNGDVRANVLHLNVTEWNNGWGISRIYYPGHSLIIGSPEGNYSHNVLDIKPGGATEGMLFSIFSMSTALSKGVHVKKVQIHTEGDTYFNGGNVGIGTNNPQKLLDVKGTIHAQNIEVDLSGWSDFVFSKDYNLPTLQEVEAHISAHNRLPDIPSEKQVREEGINIGEMQAKLLQKIEELTLYVIDQNKKIEAQNQEIETLKGIISVK